MEHKKHIELLPGIKKNSRFFPIIILVKIKRYVYLYLNHYYTYKHKIFVILRQFNVNYGLNNSINSKIVYVVFVTPLVQGKLSRI